MKPKATTEDEEVAGQHTCIRLAGFADVSERAIAEYLEKLGRKVTKIPGPVAAAGQVGDATVDGLPHEFRTLHPGATANTIVNLVKNTLRRGGKVRRIVMDGRTSDLNQESARSATIRAVETACGMIDHVAVIGDDFFVVQGPL